MSDNEMVPRSDLDAANARAERAERNNTKQLDSIDAHRRRIEQLEAERNAFKADANNGGEVCAKLLAERDAALASAAAMREAWEGFSAALGDYFDVYGVEHKDGCPEDDTCDCDCVSAINRAEAKVRAALSPTAPSDYLARVKKLEQENFALHDGLRGWKAECAKAEERAKVADETRAAIHEVSALVDGIDRDCCGTLAERVKATLARVRAEARASAIEEVLRHCEGTLKNIQDRIVWSSWTAVARSIVMDIMRVVRALAAAPSPTKEPTK
jgi:chromosome segregation ATPase